MNNTFKNVGFMADNGVLLRFYLRLRDVLVDVSLNVLLGMLVHVLLDGSDITCTTCDRKPRREEKQGLQVKTAKQRNHTTATLTTTTSDNPFHMRLGAGVHRKIQSFAALAHRRRAIHGQIDMRSQRE
jgi:hypothetical protein